MINNTQKGKQGEQLACEYLKKTGYKIIEQNWHFSKNAMIISEYSPPILNGVRDINSFC